jgi:hypothetical protein
VEQALNPFHVLGLAVSADTESIVERGEELIDTGTPEEGKLVHDAKSELLRRADTRVLHELLEVPGADYRNDTWERFVTAHRAVPVDAAELAALTGAVRAEDFDLPELIRLFLERHLRPPEPDIAPALREAPEPAELDRQPLEVRDVLFG